MNVNFCPHCGGDLRSMQPPTGEPRVVEKPPTVRELLQPIKGVEPIRSDFATDDAWERHVTAKAATIRQMRLDAALSAWREDFRDQPDAIMPGDDELLEWYGAGARLDGSVDTLRRTLMAEWLAATPPGTPSPSDSQLVAWKREQRARAAAARAID